MNQGDKRLDSYKFTNWGDVTFNKGSFKLHPEAALSEGCVRTTGKVRETEHTVTRLAPLTPN